MKKKVFSLMMMLLLAVSGFVRADELTVNEGTATNGYVPVYGFYADAYLKCEYVVPGDALVDMIGANINQMTYYAASPAAASWGDANFQVFMKEVDFTTISAFQGMDGATMVYEGSLDGTQPTMEIAFSTPYHYNGGNLLIGIYNTVKGTYKTISWSGEAVDGASYQGYSYSSLEAVSGYQRNFLPKTTFGYTTGGAPVGDRLHVKYMDGDVEVIDVLDLGVRPAGAWMEPFNFTMYSEGPTYTVNILDFTPSDGMFTVEGEELPFQVVRDNDIDLTMVCNGTQAGVIERQFVAITEGDRAAHIWPVSVELYAPEVPDVWELACEEATTFPFVEVPATAHNTVLHNDYTLPFPEIPEGYDAVYKLVFDEDQMLDANVSYGENGKVALYREGFEGEGGPMATNYYTGLDMNGGGATAAPFEAQIGEGTTTFGYFPFYTLYNYSIAENLFLAAELEGAGVTTAPMTSLSWYATNAPGYAQQGISIWMANVADETLTTTSHVVTDMTLVYTGAMTPAIGWNEFVFNEGSFAWDGHSNILIYCQRNNGAWNSTVYWASTPSMPFTASAYKYQDSAAYDPTVPQSMSTSTTRPNIIMKGGNRSRTLAGLSTSTANPGTNTNANLNRDGWMYYDNGTYSTNVGAGGTIYWGTMFPASMLTENRLTKVALYENDENTGVITLNVYSGGNTAPGTQIYTQNITPVGGDAFHEVTLNSPVTIDPSQNLWIVFYQSGDAYPATACDGTSYPNNRWVSLDGGEWYDLAEAGLPGYEWMIRAYLENNAPVPPTPPTPGIEYVAGPVIENLPVVPGTYYLVASSTTADFEVTINAEDMPCPPVEDFAFNPIPADNADEIEPASVTLTWSIPAYATGWRLIFGSTYHPEVGHPQTIIYPEDGSFTNQMASSYTVRNLWNNTNYFWRVEFNNDGCPEGVSSPVWGFTTHLNVPQGLTAVDQTVFDDETIVLNWNAVVDRTYRMYNVYRDGELVGHTQVNNIGNTTYTDGPLAYNMNGYTYYVTAVYDEGESAPSNTVNVKVSGYGDVNGHVFEQDGTTGIAGATVTMIGLDEFNVSHTYNFQTNAQGYYSGHIYAGSYNGQAAKDGYQTITEPVQGNPIAIDYNNTTSPIDYILDENFDPVCTVIAEYYPDSLDPQSPYVKVYWGCGLPGEEIIEDFETGDFSMFDWQVDNNYPWTVVTTNPYEGNYCMKSGGAGVANVVSNMTVTVNIPADGEMSFFGKISSENNWDYGYFLIDNQQMGSYTGAGNWAERTFPITAGDHTFQWRYTKDGSVNSNDDCFYVDYINFYKQPEPAQPGWVFYDDGVNVDAIGLTAGGSFYWGVMFPAGSYAGNTVSKVSMYDYSAHTGTIMIYQGGAAAPGTLLYTQPYSCTGSENFVEWTLNTPVSIDPTQQLWIVMNNDNGQYVASACANTGDANGRWISLDGTTWEDVASYGLDYTWMIRAYVANGAKGAYVAPMGLAADVAPAKAPVRVKGETPNIFAASGANTTHNVGVPTMAANNNRALSHYRVYRTNCYNDGPYTEENTVLLATVWVPDTVYIDVEWADLEPGVYKWGVGTVYEGNRGEEIAGPINWSDPVNVNRATLTYDFDDSSLQGWTTIDANNDGYDWVLGSQIGGVYLVSGASLEGSGHNSSTDMMCSGSYSNATSSAITPDNYLVSPQVALGGSISFWACGQDASYVAEHFGVAVSTTSNTSASAFTTIQEWTMTAKSGGNVMSTGRDGNNRVQGSWYQYTVDLSAYSGNGYVAIRHFNCNDQFILNVDDITIVEGAGGPTPPTPPTPGTGLQLPRESEIVWSNCLDKDMWLAENELDVTVLLNSADSPEGVTVSFLNLNEVEQELYPMAPITLDETGFYAWDTFRKGDYQVSVTLEGYEPIVENVSIWEPTSLRYVMIEIIYGVSDLYVSRTGWAMWEGQGSVTPPTPPTPGQGDSFTVDFEAGLPTGWNVIDANNDGWTWCLTSAIPTTWTYYSSLTLDWYHGGTNAICSGSYINGVGSLNPDEYLVSPQVTLAAGSQLSFWVAATDPNYAADHFGVFVSDNGTSDWTSVQEWTLTGKKGGMIGAPASRDGRGDRIGTWHNYTVDLSAYAGQKYIAFRHFNCYDQYIMCLDDIELTTGAKDGERHLEGYKVMCTSIDGEPIFTTNTVYPFCQVATDELVEGDHYICKVAAIYSTGMSDWTEAEWEYESCEHYAGTVNGVTVDGNTISWDYPAGGPVPPTPGPGDSFTVDFEAGLPTGWNVIDANNDGWTWCLTSAIPTTWTYYSSLTLDWYHGGTNAICSGSYINGVGSLNPDEYLVSPQVTLAAGSQLSFWVAATDPNYAADHFGVFVSDNGTSDWTSVQEWTLTGKKGGMIGAPASRDGRGDRIGTWHNYTVDLSAFAGQKYIAFRHFNCYDQYIMCLDDIELTSGAKSDRDVAFFNGFVTDPGAMANGADASWIKGSQSTWGPNVNNGGGYKLGDSFTLTAATTINEIEVYGYQTGSSSTSTFTGLYAQIFNGNPMSGGTAIWGSETTNIMTATSFTNCYRGSDGETTATTRPIMAVTASNLNIDLEAGTYWLVYSLEGTGSSGPWGAPHAEPGIGNTGNGVQYTSTGWQSLTDSGAGTTYGCAMKISGNGSGPVPPTPSGDVLGAMIFVDGEWEAFVPAPTNTYTYEGEGNEICVRMVYNGANELPSNNFFYAMSCEECEEITPVGPGTCEPGAPIHSELVDANHIKVWWGEQPAAPVSEWLYYDDGVYGTSIGVGGGVIYWGTMFPAASIAPYAGTNLTKVALYENSYNTDQVTVNIYLGGTTAPGTMVSTMNYNPVGGDAFHEVTLSTPVAIDGTQNLWIVFSENGTYPANACADTGDPNNRWVSLDGADWMDVAEAGVPGYGWMIRGFVTNEGKGGMVENIALEQPAVMETSAGKTLSHTEVVSKPADLSFMNRANIMKYNVYRSTEANGTYTMIGEVAETGATYYEYIDSPTEAGTYYYQVRAYYDDDCESEPAMAADDPAHNYVSETTTATGLVENDDNVALYPNPTNGNVTIEAAGMSRITVVSVLGQVVYDTELDADNYILNMGQFNAGLYMVRVYTENGVTVKRVTVMQ